MEKKEYRSAARSRKMIRQAFFELLKEKSFEKRKTLHFITKKLRFMLLETFRMESRLE